MIGFLFFRSLGYIQKETVMVHIMYIYTYAWEKILLGCFVNDICHEMELS